MIDITNLLARREPLRSQRVIISAAVQRKLLRFASSQFAASAQLALFSVAPRDGIEVEYAHAVGELFDAWCEAACRKVARENESFFVVERCWSNFDGRLAPGDITFFGDYSARLTEQSVFIELDVEQS